MPITPKIDLSKQFSTFIATGEIYSNEIVELIESYYKKQSRNNVLWDFRYANPEALLFPDELENIIANFIKQHWKLQGGRKTAIVASTDLWFRLARMYLTFAEIENISHVIRVFRFMDEAIKWFGTEK